MAVTDNLAAPNANAHQMGRFTLNRIVRCEASASAPVTWTNLSNIVSIDVGEPSWDYEADVYQQGGGDDKTHIYRGPRWDGTITVLSGKVGDVIASIQGLTWGSSNVAISLRMDNDNPQVIWEAVCRDDDNNDHLFSLVLQDMILDNVGFTNPMDYTDRSIPFHTYHEPFLIYDGYEMVYDVYSATPTTTVYTLSSTPATLLTASDHDDWHYDNAVFVKQKDDSAGDTIGKRITSGVTISGVSLTFTSSGPAASDKVYALYTTAT